MPLRQSRRSQWSCWQRTPARNLLRRPRPPDRRLLQQNRHFCAYRSPRTQGLFCPFATCGPNRHRHGLGARLLIPSRSKPMHEAKHSPRGHERIAIEILPMTSAIRSIVHPTDFSDLSAAAFAHALRIALAARSKLHLLHVSQYDARRSIGVPARATAAGAMGNVGSGRSAMGESRASSESRSTTSASHLQEPTRAIVDFLREHASDLVVLATHGRDGVEHWLKGSVAEAVFRRSAIPTLFIAPGARGFVGQISGDIQLRRALVPVDFSPPAEPSARSHSAVRQTSDGRGHRRCISCTSDTRRRRCGPSDGQMHTPCRRSCCDPATSCRSIVDAAIELDVDVIGMPTAGHHGVLDALRGSTTERVIRHAPCPVFALAMA